MNRRTAKAKNQMRQILHSIRPQKVHIYLTTDKQLVMGLKGQYQTSGKAEQSSIANMVCIVQILNHTTRESNGPHYGPFLFVVRRQHFVIAKIRLYSALGFT